MGCKCIDIDKTNWDVIERRGMWVGRIAYRVSEHPVQQRMVSEGYIQIMPTSFPEELAIDALLEFIDRLREGRIPRGVTDPEEMMGLAVSAARRQR